MQPNGIFVLLLILSHLVTATAEPIRIHQIENTNYYDTQCPTPEGTLYFNSALFDLGYRSNKPNSPLQSFETLLIEQIQNCENCVSVTYSNSEDTFNIYQIDFYNLNSPNAVADLAFLEDSGLKNIYLKGIRCLKN